MNKMDNWYSPTYDRLKDIMIEYTTDTNGIEMVIDADTGMLEEYITPYWILSVSFDRTDEYMISITDREKDTISKVRIANNYKDLILALMHYKVLALDRNIIASIRALQYKEVTELIKEILVTSGIEWCVNISDFLSRHFTVFCIFKEGPSGSKELYTVTIPREDIKVRGRIYSCGFSPPKLIMDMPLRKPEHLEGFLFDEI